MNPQLQELAKAIARVLAKRWRKLTSQTPKPPARPSEDKPRNAPVQ